MGNTNYPSGFANGVTIRGVPLLNLYPWDVYWVDSNYGSDGNKGTFDRPFATVDYVIGRCTASKGDLIVAKAGHAENLATATAINFDVAGVGLVGLGSGNLIPTFSTTAAAGSITTGAASCLLHNIRITSNFATGTTIGLTVAAAGDGLTLSKVQMRETAITSEFLTWLAIATTVTDLWMEDCDLTGLVGGSDVNAIIFAGTSQDCVFKNNFIFADCSGNLIDHDTGASVNLRFLDNRLINMDTGAAGDVISVKSDGTGYAAGNYGFYNKTDATVFTGAAMVWEQNFANNTLANSGILIPADVAAVP